MDKKLAPLEPKTITLAQEQLDPVSVYLASLQSRHSRRTMRTRLCHLGWILTLPHDTDWRTVPSRQRFCASEQLAAIPWSQLRGHHTTALRAFLLEEAQSDQTVNLALSALRGVLTTCRRLGLMTADHAQAAIDGLSHVKAATQSAAAGRMLSPDEIHDLLQVCANDDSACGTRDAAIIALMYSLGLRRAEVVALNLNSLMSTETGWQVSILGKGNKQRTAYVAGGAAELLEDWLAVRGDHAGPLFLRLAHHSSGGAANGRLSSQSIYKLLQKRGAEADLESFTPHDLRRSCISTHLDAGTDIVTVASIVGHSSVETTRRYDRRGERAKQRAAHMVSVTVPKPSQE